MKRFLTASAALALIALPPVLHATSNATTYESPYVARYSLDYYKNDPVPLTATEIRRLEKAAALYKRTGKITIIKPRVMPQSPASVASGSAGSSSCVPAGTGSGVAPPAAQAPAAIVGPTAVELRRQAKADMLYKRTGIRTVLRPLTPKASQNAAPVVATVAAATGVPCPAVPPTLAALSPNSGGPLDQSIQSGSLLGTPGSIGSVVQVVPEPGTLGLLGLGLLGLGLSRRKIARISR
jgi:PEP-CTERM motif